MIRNMLRKLDYIEGDPNNFIIAFLKKDYQLCKLYFFDSIIDEEKIKFLIYDKEVFEFLPSQNVFENPKGLLENYKNIVIS